METMTTLSGITLIINVSICSLLISFNSLDSTMILSAITIVSTSSNAIADGFRHFVELNASKSIKNKIFSGIIKSENVKSKKIITPKQEITINNLSFKYKKTLVFSDLNFKFDKYKSYAIIGSSDSGKSTPAKILMKIEKDYSGNIFFENIPLKQFKEEDIYDLIYYIPQDNFILKDSLYNNISMYKDYRCKSL
ncbi:ATP-binding cassette domain-containing protein [Anaerococcus sp. AGMB00486]|uniref:ATP-binding cassette domain-containing protein n=1 Tax=Anaerococcus faecalis TaxID=2742993 RepID=A0ABX2N748_9FIRM|nr:ATP-binding cassette domain-containing protein [Anaerococcus faecalis]NVF10495.1 ATP-binding cassette domain-containing protein [Anaerococcus faecalis]